MISLTTEQELLIRWYIDFLYSYESTRNEWAKNNKSEWIENMYKSFYITDKETFIKRYNNIKNLYEKKDDISFVFPFIECLKNEVQYLYKS